MHLGRLGCVLLFGAMAAAQDASPAAEDPAVLRLARLLMLEDFRSQDSAAWDAVLAESDAPAWRARVALARRRTTVDPFAAEPAASDKEALLKTLAEAETPESARRAAHDLARAKGKLPAAFKGPLTAALPAVDEETAGFVARALARVEGAGESESAEITAAYLSGGGRVAQIDRLRALAGLPAGPSRPALLKAVMGEDPHLRRVAFETMTAASDTFAERDRSGLAKLAAAASEADRVDDVRAAAVGAFAALDRDAFLAAVPRYRLSAPWPVRAEAARRIGLFGFGQALATEGAFVGDPDRRVSQALLESASEELDRRKDEARHMTLAPAFAHAARALSRPFYGTGASSCDPVETALRAKWLKSMISGGALKASDLSTDERRRLLAGVPSHEVELLQMVVDLLEAAKDDALLTEIVRTAVEPSIASYAAAARSRIGAPLAADYRPPVVARTHAEFVEIARFALDPAPLRAVVKTERGEIVFRLHRDVAPMTVRNFAALARRGFFNGILFHRVVPGFVAQAGCPRGDGYGGPGYTIRCETSDRPYSRGTLGMALAGKDTGGSQWFVTHRSTPHLDGKYAAFGEVESGFDALDALVQGDRIDSIVVGP